ncbi:hypothetical protein, partial [Symmachiella dynata]|uniref:hypothetical protein n=1 Tax=Symmachiella dynata TaxID=2527995 RepID=UPI001E4180EC
KTPDNTALISHNKTDFNSGSPTSAYNSPSAITLIPTGCFCAPVCGDYCTWGEYLFTRETLLFVF